MYRLLILFLAFSNVIHGQNNRGVIIEQEAQNEVSGKFHAIIISENRYQDDKINDLNEPKNDADKLTQFLFQNTFSNKMILSVWLIPLEQIF